MTHEMAPEAARPELSDSPCGLAVATIDGRLLNVNAALERLTGRPSAELLSLPFVSLLTPAGQIYFETNLQPVLRIREEVQEAALELRRLDGTRVPVLVSAHVSDHDGLVRLAVFAATHRRAYEQEMLVAKERAEAAERRARELARTVQQVLIPPRPPSIPGVDVAASYRPAGDGEEVGGDFYDVFQVADDWFAIIGDIRGKGAEAAVVTSLMRHAVHVAAASDPLPDSILRTVNRVLLDDDDTDRFCTAVLAKLTSSGTRWHLQVAVAGHPLPVLIDTDGTCQTVGEPGSLLGVLDDIAVSTTAVPFDRGQTLLMFTDGVTEARRDDRFFGEDRLYAAAVRHRGSADSVVAGVLDEVLEFQAGRAVDDIALIGIRLLMPTGTI